MLVFVLVVVFGLIRSEIDLLMIASESCLKSGKGFMWGFGIKGLSAYTLSP